MRKCLLTLALAGICTVSQAQTLWNGILDPSRAIVWNPGAPLINETRTQCGSTIAAYTGTAATINNAIAACGAHQYVLLGAGTFTLSSGINFFKTGTTPNSYVTLRGQGANSTFIVFSGSISNSNYCNGHDVCAAGGDNNYANGGAINSANWLGSCITLPCTSGTYAKNAAYVLLSADTNLSNGAPLILDQIDNQTDNGNLYVGCEIYDQSNPCYNGTSTSGFQRGDGSLTTVRGQQQIVNVNGTITGTGPYTVPISPTIYAANWNSAQSPGAWWSSIPVYGDAVEDLSLDHTNNGSTATDGIIFYNCTGCWAKGIRSIRNSSTSANWGHVDLASCNKCTVRDSYFWGFACGTSGGSCDTYGIPAQTASDDLVENNISQLPGETQFYNSDCEGCAATYNYAAGTGFSSAGSNWLGAPNQFHSIVLFALAEGNITAAYYGDNFHGCHDLNTFFRNRWDGYQTNQGYVTSSETVPLRMNPCDRYENGIFNVIGSQLLHQLYSSSPPGTNLYTSVVGLGTYPEVGLACGPSSGLIACADSLVATTRYLWGNYAECRSTSTSAECNAQSFNSAEVPSSGLPGGLYQNAVPSTHTAPPSFLYSSQPSWWPAGKVWPPVHPENTTGGNAGQCYKTSTGIAPCTDTGVTFCSSEATNASQCGSGESFALSAGGRVTSNPAMDCYLNTMSGAANGTGGPYAFDRLTCYPAASTAPVVSLSATTLTFGPQASGTTSAGQSITVTNTGTATLNISSIAIANVLPTSTQFANTTTCGSTLTASSSCTITVTFHPTYFAPKTATLVLTTNATSSPNNISLTGIGAPAGSNMVLYQSGTHPAQQINAYAPPINSSVSTYSHLIGSGTGILNLFTPGQYLTGVTWFPNVGCTASNCTGANGTYLDHVGTSSIAGGGCPNIVFSGSSPQDIDNVVDKVAALGYWNNFIPVNTSYGAGGGTGNTATPGYEFTQDWADNLDTDCAHQSGVLSRQNSGYYLPGDYILFGGQYWQMTKLTCSNATGTDTHYDACKTATSPPACLLTPSSPCVDGTGSCSTGNAACWTLTPSSGLHAPPQDGWCDSTYPGSLSLPCYSLVVNGTASINGSGVATITVSSIPTYANGNTGFISGVSGVNGSNFNCGSATSTTATIQSINQSTNQVSYTCSPALTTTASTTLTGGQISAAHSLNINTAPLPLLQATFPIPYELPNRVRLQSLWASMDTHYKNSIGYIRMGLSKGGESSQDNSNLWPWYTANQYLSYEKVMYAFESGAGGGTDFACVGNLNTNPNQEAVYIYGANCGGDNNALSTDHAYTLGCYASTPAPAWCGTVTYNSGVPADGSLLHGGNWAELFKTYNTTTPNGDYPTQTIQTTNASNPGSTPGNCSVNTCANGTCTVPSGSQPITGSLSIDTGCTNTTLTGGGPFPAPNGYPGDLPLIQQYLATNLEAYFCDIALMLDPNYPPSGCSSYSQTTYAPLYKSAASTFLTQSTTVPVFTSAATAFFTINVFNTFTVAATGTPTPAFTIIGGTLPSGVTFVDNGTGNATLSGTPTTVAVVTLTIHAANSAGSVNQTFTLNIIPGGSCFGCSGVGTGQFVISGAASNFPTTPADDMYCGTSGTPTWGVSDGPATLPTDCLNTNPANSPATGSVVNVTTAGQLTTALAAASCGQQITLAAGSSFSGNFTAPALSCPSNNWLIIQSSAVSSLPVYSARYSTTYEGATVYLPQFSPCYSGVTSLTGRPTMHCPSTPGTYTAQIITPNSTAALTLSANTSNVRFIGIEFTRTASTGLTTQLIGMGGVGGISHVIFDRVWCHGDENQDETTRCFSATQTDHVAVIDSYFNDFYCISVSGACVDSQTLITGLDAANTTGENTLKVVNNYLEAAGETMEFGGGAATAVPYNFEIRLNLMTKPLQWNPSDPSYNGGIGGHALVVKNLYEMKTGNLTLFEGNQLFNVWAGFTQTGTAIPIGAKNQSGGCSVCEITNLVMRYSTVNTAGLMTDISIGPSDTNAMAAAQNAISVHDLIGDNLGYSTCNSCSVTNPMIGLTESDQYITSTAQAEHNVTVNHVTMVGANGATALQGALGLSGMLQSTGFQMYGMTFTNNVFVTQDFGTQNVLGNGSVNCAYGVTAGAAAINACWTGSTFGGNCIIGTPTRTWPGVNNVTSIATQSSVYTSWNNGENGTYTIAAGACKGIGTDTLDPGANVSEVASVIAGNHP
ncbi:MAG TPA: choice-of-anchor D domain-containing protein [Candidatus Acidoferrales bacterium]|nr:choice-of-anchor D domain-containing protein [Candidatus Acidoferrales bacterium]